MTCLIGGILVILFILIKTAPDDLNEDLKQAEKEILNKV